MVSNIDMIIAESVHSELNGIEPLAKKDTVMVYTVEQVADILQVSASTVRKLIREKKLRVTRVGVQIRVTQEELDRFLKSQTS